jgi:glutamate-5-semialdehyde dehydrogenase
MPVVVDGDHVLRVTDDIAARFRPGDALFAVAKTGQLLLVPAEQKRIVSAAVGRAARAFEQMSAVRAEDITRFFSGFAERLGDDRVWERIASRNREDVADAMRRGRSTTRLLATEKLRQGMIDGLHTWASAGSRRGEVLETVQHDGWVAELVGAELGVIGFVFEGRPNVLADATGVLRGGNTVVFRIGRDALGTARAIMELALTPALEAAGLPNGACVLVESAEHAAGWALFSERRLALAVARGSGAAVDTLGSLAQQAGVPVSLHGTGGAWLVTGITASAPAFHDAVLESLDRKVCNTLNVCCIPEKRAAELVPVLLEAAAEAGRRRTQAFKLHVVRDDARHVPGELFDKLVRVQRAEGARDERQAELIDEAELGREWEWEETPELSLKIVRDTREAVDLFNRFSPQFVACLVSSDAAEHQWFYENVNAPFVGDGFTRWVDGQFALRRPELGLSNWQNGRLLGRGGILSGDSVYTVRTRARRQR